MWNCIDAMMIVIDDYFEIKYDHEDLDFLRRLADGYEKYYRGRAYGCTLAVDGMFLGSEKPTAHDLQYSDNRDNNYYSSTHKSYGLIALIGD